MADDVNNAQVPDYSQAAAPIAAPQAPTEVHVFNPDGELGVIPVTQLQAAIGSGYTEASPEDISKHQAEQEYGGAGSQAVAGLEGVARGVAGPLATASELALGVPEKDIRGRAEANPVTHGVGEAAGLVGGMFTGAGEGALAAKAGELGSKALGLGAEGAGALAKIGEHAATAAIENGFIQGSDETSKMLLHDPDQSAQSAIANVGLSGLLGGGLGATIGAISPLWNAAAGAKTGQLIEDFKGRMKYHVDNPEPVTAVTDELTSHYGNIRGIADDVYGAQGLKARDIAAAMPENNGPKIIDQAGTINQKLEDNLQKLVKTDDPHAKLLQQEIGKYQEAVNTHASPEDIFNATQNLKQQLQEWGKFNKDMVPLSERQFRETAKSLSHDLRLSLEDPSVWGKAGERQQAINKAFTEFAPALKDFESKFTSKVGGEKVIDPGKVQTYVNQLGKNTSVLKKGMVKDFLDASDKYLNVIDQSHANLGLSPVERTSVAMLRDTLKDLTPGAKLADYVVAKGAANLAGQGLGAGVGAGVGHHFGVGGIGALVGEHALGPFLSSVLPSIVKPMIEKTNNSIGLKAGIDYALQAAKGENILGKSIKNLFVAGREMAPKAIEVSASDRQKLDKKLSLLKLDQSSLTKTGGQAAHYLPDHGGAMGKTAVNAVNYLNSLRPNTDRAAPLDPKLPPDPVKQARYNQALNIAEKPLLVLDKLKHGTLLPQDVADLHTMYPALYNNIVNKLTAEIANTMSKGGNIPYQTRVGMSMLMQQPLDSTMTPQAIIAAQMSLNQPSSRPNGQENQQQKPAAKSTAGLNKIGQMYQTPGQNRESDRQKH